MRTSNSDVIGQVSRKLKPVLLRIRNWIHLLKYFLNGSSVGHISEDALHRFWLVLRWVTRQTYGQLVAAAGCRHQLRSYNSFKYNMPLSAQTHASVIRHDHSYRTMTLEQSASRHSPAYNISVTICRYFDRVSWAPIEVLHQQSCSCQNGTCY